MKFKNLFVGVTLLSLTDAIACLVTYIENDGKAFKVLFNIFNFIRILIIVLTIISIVLALIKLRKYQKFYSNITA